jgi:hypothetical protein
MTIIRKKRKLWVILLIISLISLIVSCHFRNQRQGWNRKWGPVVSHKTFPGDCGICHVSDDWHTIKTNITFNHEKETGYALKGAHKEASCLRCHNDRGPVADYIARGCAGCHPDPHASSLGLDCEKCHGQTDWAPTGLIAEHTQTRFPLVGAHAVVPCESCHLQAATGQFRGAPVQCELCHQRELAEAKSPDHLTNGWTTDCERCHTPVGWSGSGFNHYFFPLTGAHKSLECTSCHTGGTFEPMPSDCYSCHADDFELGPDHTTLNFPHTCNQCHRTSSWVPAYFRHPFPREGVHDVDCILCHTTGSVSVFNCLDCHDKSSTDDHHHEVSGYNYNSQACYRCHRNGRAGDGDD